MKADCGSPINEDYRPAQSLPYGQPLLRLMVRVPLELLNKHVLAEQSGVLAILSRWRSGVQIPSGTLTRHGTQTGKATKLKPTRKAAERTARIKADRVSPKGKTIVPR